MKFTLTDYSSTYFCINTSVPEGFIIGPNLFLIFPNDLPDCISSQLPTYANDATICSCLDIKFHRLENVKLVADLTNDLVCNN